MFFLFYSLIIIMRSIRSFLMFWLFCLLLWTVSAFSLDDFIVQFQSASTNLSLAGEKAYYLKVYNNMSLLALRNHDNAEQSALYTSLKDYVYTQLQNLWTTSLSTSSTISSGMNIPNVDLAKVRATWLALHTTERSIKKLTPFTYSSALEWTATTWAQHLADIGKAIHQRKSTDGYYSYDSIKTWFIDQWITFATQEKNGQTIFTENLWRWYYTCKKSDCTDDFIKAIKTSRAFFMSEKGKKSRPHYNAIVGNYSTIGLGVAVVGNKYYLVSHYTQDLK